MEITDVRVERLAVPCEPGISDSDKTWDTAGVAYLELETDAGLTGIGLGGSIIDYLLRVFGRH